MGLSRSRPYPSEENHQRPSRKEDRDALSKLFQQHGQADSRQLAFILRTSVAELAVAAGVDLKELQGPEIISDETQSRFDNLVDVLNKVGPQFDTPVMAYKWYRSEPLAGFDGQTAMQLVHAGKAQQVVKYIYAVGAGIFY